MSKELHTENSFQTSRFERISYGLYFFGQNLLYTIVATYISIFLLNQGLSETAVAALLIAPKIFDAVNDPIFGVMVDKIKFKKGRFIPWLKISWLFIPLATVFTFCMPVGISTGFKIAWAVVGYVLWDLGYTMCDIPIYALSTSLCENVKERTTIISLGRVLGTIGAMAATLSIEAIYISIGWKVLAVGLSLIAMLFMLPILIVGKERAHCEIEKNPTLKEMFSSFIKNKYLLIFYLTFFILGVTNTMLLVIPIFSQYVLGDTGMGTVLLAIGMLPALLIAVLLPTLVKKIDKFYIYIACLIIFIVSSILQYFTGYQNTIVLYITMVLRGIGMGGYSVLGFMFTPDCVEYGHFRTGTRQEGVSFSLQTFITKLTSAIVNSLSLMVLAWFGFKAADADPVTGIVSKTAAGGCWQVMTWFSVVGCIIAVPLLLTFYKLRDRDVQLMARYNNGEMTRDECEAQLSRKY